MVGLYLGIEEEITDSILFYHFEPTQDSPEFKRHKHRYLFFPEEILSLELLLENCTTEEVKLKILREQLIYDI